MLRDLRDRNTSKYITYRNLAILALTISVAFNICLYIKTQSIQNEMDDWASLSSYSVSNAVLSPQVPGRVVFMGDSITYYWDFAGYFPGKPYVNRGISGQSTPQMLVRFRADAIDLQPDIVVILGGTNDLAGLTGYQPTRIIEGNLLSMADLARENGITVILASILPVCGDYVTERPPRLINEINAFIKSYCEKNNIIYLDYHSALVGEDGLLRPELSDDCLHLNVEGYKVMALLAEEAMEQALAQREENLVVD